MNRKNPGPLDMVNKIRWATAVWMTLVVWRVGHCSNEKNGWGTHSWLSTQNVSISLNQFQKSLLQSGRNSSPFPNKTSQFDERMMNRFQVNPQLLKKNQKGPVLLKSPNSARATDLVGGSSHDERTSCSGFHGVVGRLEGKHHSPIRRGLTTN